MEFTSLLFQLLTFSHKVFRLPLRVYGEAERFPGDCVEEEGVTYSNPSLIWILSYLRILALDGIW